MKQKFFLTMRYGRFFFQDYTLYQLKFGTGVADLLKSQAFDLLHEWSIGTVDNQTHCPINSFIDYLFYS